MKLQPAVVLVTVPQASGFPHSIFISSLFRRKNLHAYSGQVTRKMEIHAGIDRGNQELIWAELRDQRGTVGITVARRTAAIVLRISVGNRRLPVAKIEFLLGLPWLLHGGLEFAFKVKLGNLTVHRPDQREITRVRFGGGVAEDVPSAGVDAEWSDTNGAFAESLEEVLGERV